MEVSVREIHLLKQKQVANAKPDEGKFVKRLLTALASTCKRRSER